MVRSGFKQCAGHGVLKTYPTRLTARNTLAASSGDTGFRCTPVPHSRPLNRVTRGRISRCQWNAASASPESGAVWSTKLQAGRSSAQSMRGHHRLERDDESLKRPSEQASNLAE